MLKQLNSDEENLTNPFSFSPQYSLWREKNSLNSQCPSLPSNIIKDCRNNGILLSASELSIDCVLKIIQF